MQQQEFLRESMKELGLTRKEFAERLGCAERTLDKWLLPNDSNDNSPMKDVIWVLVREIRAHEKLKKEHQSLMKKINKNMA